MTDIATSPQELIDRVHAIGPLLRENAHQAEEDARLPQSSLDAMREAGLFRLYAPRSLGGLEIDPVSHIRIQEEVARYDTAASWFIQNVSGSIWFASRLPTEAVEEIYGDNPDQSVTVSFATPIEATATDGGFLLSGQRSLASNSSDSSWAWLTALNMINGEPEMIDGVPVMRACFFPTSDATIVPTWDSLGMRGTDSNDILVDNVFVPEHRTFRIGIDHTPGPLFDGPLYRMPVMSVAASWVVGVMLGLAREAIDQLVALAEGKTPFSSNMTLRERGVVQSKVGRAEGLLRSARTYVHDRIDDAWTHTQAGREYSLEQKTEVALAAVQAWDSAVTVTDMMYSVAGSTVIYKRHPLEKLFRDAHVLRQHGFVNESRFETVGQVRMGLDPELGFVAL